MSLIKFFETLNPFTKKNELLEKIRLINESLDDTTQMWTMVGGEEFKGALSSPPNLTPHLVKAIRASGFGKYKVTDDNLPEFFVGLLGRLDVNLKVIRDLFDKSSEGDVSKDGITYRRLTAMNMVSAISFASTYAHRFLTVHTMDRAQFETKWVMDHTKQFAAILSIVDITQSDLDTVLKTLPDKVFTPDGYDTDAAISGSSTIDPLQFNLMGLSWNPFYYVGVKWAQLNINKMEANKADLKALQFQTSLLKDRRSGVEDPALEKQIQVYESDAVALAESIHKTERRYGIHQ